MPKLLIVDDSLTDRVRVAGVASQWADCVIVEADNGVTALKAIESHRPDLVLTDLQMPQMNGLELVAAVKEDYPYIPVVLMTGQGSESIAAQALRAGATSYVPKNRVAMDLVATLNQVYAASQVAHSQFRLMHYMVSGVTEYVLPSDPAVIKACVDLLLNMLRCLPLGDESERLRVGIALHEALDNACHHGNLGLPAEARSDSAKFAETAALRSRSEPWGLRRIHVTARISRECAQFVIRDEGDGFDIRIASEEDESSSVRTGRGITLMKSIMDDVTYNDTGNEVTMTRNAVQPTDEIDDD